MIRSMGWALPYAVALVGCVATFVGCAAEATCEELQNCAAPPHDGAVDDKGPTEDGSPIDKGPTQDVSPIEGSLPDSKIEASVDPSVESAPVGDERLDSAIDTPTDPRAGEPSAPVDTDAHGNAEASLPNADAGSIGRSCNANTDCASQHCIENVCCDMPCAGSCMSCVAANTGTTSGMCAPITAGIDPYDSCAVDNVTSCGNDGTCDGQGGCRKYGTSVVCQPESCNNNDGTHTTYTPASHCNASHACASASSPPNCGNFLCASGTSQCSTRCQSSSDCITSAYCANNSCVPKKALGAICAATGECASSFCGGRCCAGPCTCPQPSAQNLFKNAGFDSDLSGWDAHNEAQWSSQDVDGCPYSGSAQILVSQGPTMCVPVTAGTSTTSADGFGIPTAIFIPVLSLRTRI